MKNLGAAILILLVVVAAGAPWLAPGDPFAMAAQPLMSPGGGHVFGTDDLGRDVFAGVVHGARTSLYVGAAAAALAGALGLLVGGLAALRGGLLDQFLMRGTDFVQALPRFLLIVTIVSLFGHRFGLIVLAIGATEWPMTARLFRAYAMSTLERDFSFAARAAGAGDLRILVRHILPLSLSVLAAQISYHAGGAILVEAGLSLLGLGDPAVMSWGTLLGSAQRFVREAWWTSLFPGVAITMTVLGCNLLAEGFAAERSHMGDI
ncbi:MAG: ABC transporter permease [Vicinamibacterales bacterium]